MNLRLSEDHPLNEYILLIDEHISDDSLLRAIGRRIGIYIPENEYASYILYENIKDYLEKETDPERTRYIINMTFPEYQKHLKEKLTEDEAYLLYENRLNNFDKL